MKFKIGDKVVLSAHGKPRHTFAKVLFSKKCYGIIKQLTPTFDTSKQERIVFVKWYNSPNLPITGFNHFAIWTFDLTSAKPKPYNHPLTPIFAEKMPTGKKHPSKKSVIFT